MTVPAECTAVRHMHSYVPFPIPDGYEMPEGEKGRESIG